jgi:hypothetical protein
MSKAKFQIFAMVRQRTKILLPWKPPYSKFYTKHKYLHDM